MIAVQLFVKLRRRMRVDCGGLHASKNKPERCLAYGSEIAADRATVISSLHCMDMATV